VRLTKLPPSARFHEAFRGEWPILLAMRCVARSLSALLVLGVMSGAIPRRANAGPVDAETLFRDGRRLLKEGKVSEACAKLAESQQLDSSSGTLLNLADCHERQGKMATAWAEFLSAARLAELSGNEIQTAEAKRRAAQLEPKLSYLTVRAPQTAPGTVVRRNNETIEAAQIGARLPIDPGECMVTAEAVGYVAFRALVVIKTEGDDAVVEVPLLKPKARVIVASKADVGVTNRRADLRNGSWWRKPTGVAGVAVGSALLAVSVTASVRVISIGEIESYKTYRHGFPPDEDACDQASTGTRVETPGAATPERVDRLCGASKALTAFQYIGYPLGALTLGAGLLAILSAPREGSRASAKTAHSRWELMPVAGRGQTGVSFYLSF
jgi:hypothetical protein